MSEQSDTPESEKTETASRWVWWIANMAMNQPYPRKDPKVGDIVVEVTHLMGLTRARLGRHSAIGELLEIDESGGEWNKRYLIRSADPAEGDNWWGNARIEVVESKSK